MGITTARHALYTPGAPPAPTSSTAIGFNNSGDSEFLGTSEGYQAWHDRYLATYDLTVLPVAKFFYSGVGALPTTWNASKEGTTSGRRVFITYQWDTTAANAAGGDMDAKIASYAASVPRGWHVYFCYFNEPDDNFKAGTANVADYKAVCARHAPIVRAAQKAPNPGAGLQGNKLEFWSCFTIPFNLNVSAATSASWLPDPGVLDGLGWDAYLNPNGVGGTRYNSLYDQHMQDRYASVWDVHRLTGVYNWGITEWGAPWRNWDTSGTARDTYCREAMDYWLAGHVQADGQLYKPKFLCFFNRKGTNWDQRLVANNVPTTFDHSGGPGGPDNPPTVSVPASMLPDEPFRFSYTNYITSNIYTPFDGNPGSI
jgi:hypothetical protein